MSDLLAAAAYRLARGRLPDLLLWKCGIPTARNYPPFLALEKALRMMPPTGAVIEFGVYRGLSLFGIAHWLKRHGDARVVKGVDWFQGLPEPTREDGPRARAGEFSALNAPAAILRRASNAGLPLALAVERVERFNFFDAVALAHVDLDLYEPTAHVLRGLLPIMVPGGVIVLDDYYSDVFLGARSATQDALRDWADSFGRVTVECGPGPTDRRLLLVRT